jgi:hypothetical protein
METAPSALPLTALLTAVIPITALTSVTSGPSKSTTPGITRVAIATAGTCSSTRSRNTVESDISDGLGYERRRPQVGHRDLATIATSAPAAAGTTVSAFGAPAPLGSIATGTAIGSIATRTLSTCVYPFGRIA